MTYRVGPKGQVVIPKSIRDHLGIHPGDEVSVTLEDHGVRVEPVRAGTDLGGSLAGFELTEILEEDRRLEQSR